MSSTRELLKGIFSGKIPVTRNNRETGTKENVYYFYDEDTQELREMNKEVKFNLDSIDRYKRIPEYMEAINSGRYRTKKTQSTDEWGKKTEKLIDNYLATEYKAPDYERYNQQKKLLKTMDKPFAYIGIPFSLEKIYSSYVSFKDFNTNKNILENSELIGGDKFFHCKANYEAAKRGDWERLIAEKLSNGREILQYLAHTDNIQDASDDMEANRRGRLGAQQGKTLEESCPRNPRDYFK